MFYLQHGFGKGNKIQNLEATGELAGVILSPANEDVSHLADTAGDALAAGLVVLLDPQSYAYSLSPKGSGTHHLSHELAFTNLHWSQTAEHVEEQIKAVKDANLRIGIDGPFIAPSAYQSSLTDLWTPISIQYARSSSSEWGPDQTFATLVIDENALASWPLVEDWLDVVTTLDVAGFYLLVSRNSPQYPPLPWNPTHLSNLLRVIYTLTELNQYALIWGYSDIDGLLGIVAGATGIASGWSYRLRQFSVNRWNEEPPGGGRAATPRVHLGRLWSPVRIDEVEYLHGSSLKSRIFSKSLSAFFDTNDFDAWSRLQAQEHHLELLAKRANRLASLADIDDRLDVAEKELKRAITLFQEIDALGIAVERRSFNLVASYAEALSMFRAAESL